MLDIIKFLDCIGIDILGLLIIIRNGNEFIMVICDYFLKWIEVYIVCNFWLYSYNSSWLIYDWVYIKIRVFKVNLYWLRLRVWILIICNVMF